MAPGGRFTCRAEPRRGGSIVAIEHAFGTPVPYPLFKDDGHGGDGRPSPAAFRSPVEHPRLQGIGRARVHLLPLHLHPRDRPGLGLALELGDDAAQDLVVTFVVMDPPRNRGQVRACGVPVAAAIEVHRVAQRPVGVRAGDDPVDVPVAGLAIVLGPILDRSG